MSRLFFQHIIFFLHIEPSKFVFGLFLNQVLSMIKQMKVGFKS